MGWQWIGMGNIQQISQTEHQCEAAGIRAEEEQDYIQILVEQVCNRLHSV